MKRVEQRLLAAVAALAAAPAALAAAALWLLSTFLASPAFFHWSWSSFAESRTADYLRLCRSPLARDLTEPIMAYRVALPTLAWALRLPPLAALALPYAVHIAFLAAALVALRRRTTPVAALLGTAALALSFALFWSNWSPGFTDTATHLCGMALLLTFLPAAAALLGFAGFVNDERMVLVFPFVYLWHFGPPARGQPLRPRLGWLAGAAAGAAAYLLLRHALTVGWIGPGIARPAVYDAISDHVRTLRPHLGSWKLWALNVALGFRWAWIVPAAAAVLLWRNGERSYAGVYAGALALAITASMVVADVSRSVAFAAPALVLALAVLARHEPQRLTRPLLWLVVLLCLTPAFYTNDLGRILWYRPLPLVLLRMRTGADVVQLLGKHS